MWCSPNSSSISIGIRAQFAPAVGLKRSSPTSTASLRKRLCDYINKEIAAGEEEGAGFITPQKMQLNCIEMVEKLVTSELASQNAEHETKGREGDSCEALSFTKARKGIKLFQLSNKDTW
ncbi:unnamed protein product [Brassica rapa]|uniref:Uncharacterized protein n=2 Tax=Brassica campestris TaxID=3711 RepID=A0A8D9M7A3_BRACM|nr:unnamed protein product [Brassica rapa]